MSTLSKQTKAQLAEIAENLGIDVTNCRVKKEYYETIRDFFQEHYDEFTPGSPYYDLAHASRLPLGSSPRKVVVSVDDSELETEQEEEGEEGEEGEGEEEEEEAEEGEVEEEEEEEDGESTTALQKKGCSFCVTSWAPVKNLIESDQVQSVLEYVSEKNQEVREYLSDPYSINDIVFTLETIFLLTKFYHTVELGSIVQIPDSIKESLPEPILSLPVFDFASLKTQFFATVAIWLIVALGLPKIVSYYVNFTYDFEYDSFTFALAKLFFGLILFRAHINTSEIQRDLDWEFGTKEFSIAYALKTLEHVALTSTIFLRNTFGNWVLVDALFTTLISLYANLAFV
ncbi:DEKNAAC105337 [Brettanomyces naardenensis]|uniref:DEKNAAC105337 n=1 Tax=Brettanomyces naardenensis TaxID=13370 RepID=A0A448YTH8_BRENA|nr:DEKNAAC105337 [Brettanomyces naardenensis]